jgi:hypothetical protein
VRKHYKFSYEIQSELWYYPIPLPDLKGLAMDVRAPGRPRTPPPLAAVLSPGSRPCPRRTRFEGAARCQSASLGLGGARVGVAPGPGRAQPTLAGAHGDEEHGRAEDHAAVVGLPPLLLRCALSWGAWALVAIG